LIFQLKQTTKIQVRVEQEVEGCFGIGRDEITDQFDELSLISGGFTILFNLCQNEVVALSIGTHLGQKVL
jgi:hypothetical protein